MNENELYKTIASNIKKYRINHNHMSQNKLARITNVSLNKIKNIERGKSNITTDISILYKISIVLEIPINRFFENNDK